MASVARRTIARRAGRDRRWKFTTTCGNERRGGRSRFESADMRLSRLRGGRGSARISGRAQRVRARPRAETRSAQRGVAAGQVRRAATARIVVVGTPIAIGIKCLTNRVHGRLPSRRRWRQRWQECPGEFRGRISVHLAVQRRGFCPRGFSLTKRDTDDE